MADIPLPSTNQPASASSPPRPTPATSSPPPSQQPVPPPPASRPAAAPPSPSTPHPPSPPAGEPSPAPPPPQSRTRQLLLGLLVGGGVALISGGCVLVLSTMFFFAFWNDGSNDMTFVTLWGLSSIFGGGLAAVVIGLILGSLLGWYIYQRF